MPRRLQPEEQTSAPADRVQWVRFTFWLVAGVLLMVSTLFAWHSTEEFLIKEERFRVPEAD